MAAKKCKTCSTIKNLHKDFDIMEGRKRYPDCNECRKLQKAGLNPTPQVIKREPIDAGRQERMRQYRLAIERKRKAAA